MRAAIALLTGCVFPIAISTAVFAASPVQGGLPAVENRVTELEERLDELAKDVANAATQDNVTALTDRVTQTEGNIINLQDRLMTLEDRVDALERDSNGLAVFDDNDQLVGKVITTDALATEALIAMKPKGQTFILTVRQNVIVGSRNLTYASTDCTGSVFGIEFPPEAIRANGFLLPPTAVAPPGKTVYVADRDMEQSFFKQSFYDTVAGECVELTGGARSTILAWEVMPAFNIVDLFEPPFRVR